VPEHARAALERARLDALRRRHLPDTAQQKDLTP